jgi:hypothetical protein
MIIAIISSEDMHGYIMVPFTLDVKSVLNENLGGILGGILEVACNVR